jgi:hypothetical protein
MHSAFCEKSARLSELYPNPDGEAMRLSTGAMSLSVRQQQGGYGTGLFAAGRIRRITEIKTPDKRTARLYYLIINLKH